jgi:hypothetical protein
MKKTFEGPASGTGASNAWVGNDKTGEGKMTITDSKPPQSIAIKLEFLKPFQATNKVSFTFAPAGEKTKVTWAMDGERNFMMKAFSVFMNMDSMVGKDFESGLAGLKTLAEAEQAKQKDAAGKAQAAAAPAPDGAAPPAPKNP